MDLTASTQPSPVVAPVQVAEEDRRARDPTTVKPVADTGGGPRDKEDRKAQSERLRQFAEPAFSEANTRLSISYDEKIGKFIYRAVDPLTGEVVKEYPSEEVRDRMARLHAAAGVAVDKSI